MRVWLRAMHLLAQGKKGLSNIELGRRLGISSAALPRRIRLALQPPLCPENHPQAPRHRLDGDPADALPPPQIG
jgi:hypothetical protein